MKYLLAFLFLTLISDVNASNDIFIEVKNKKNDLVIGHYSNPSAKQVIIKEFSVDSISKINYRKILNIDSSKKILIYFHAMWGNGNKSQRNNLKLFQKLCKGDKEGNPYQIINIVWKAGSLNYKKNWYHAFEIGKMLNPVFKNIFKEKGNYNILCHSMGHRVFEGIMTNSKQNFLFENVLFFAADLDADVFEKQLKPLFNSTERINIYIHNKDRLLRYSKRRHKRQRLGLGGVSDHKVVLSDNVKIINVSSTKAKGSKNISRHLYFKKDEKVMTDLQRILAGDFEKRELTLISETVNEYKL